MERPGIDEFLGLRLRSTGLIDARIRTVRGNDAPALRQSILGKDLSFPNFDRDLLAMTGDYSLRLGQPAIELVGECLPVACAEIRWPTRDQALAAQPI
jgi:hypothetical protein